MKSNFENLQDRDIFSKMNWVDELKWEKNYKESCNLAL